MKVVALGAMMCVAALAETPTITGVTAQQRYPWNGKVNISYTVTGDIAAEAKQRAFIASLKVTAIDMMANTTNVATQLSGDTNLTEGVHSFVWDMDAEGLTLKSTNVIFRVACETTNALYCVIDLSAGATATSYPVTYLAEPPSGGFNVDEYKTTKLVLRRLEAGTYKMQNETNVMLSKPFYIGVFEVTQKQYQLVMGLNPSSVFGDTLPVETVSYNTIRGSSNGSQWPESSAVDLASCIGKLRVRTELNFDLPMEAQWEYACRAGTSTTYYWGDSMNGSYAWYTGNSGSKPHIVGTKMPNAWGLYDMSGNLWEWCLDWKGTLAYGTDPRGFPSGSDRVKRGGCYVNYEGSCTSSVRGGDAPSREHYSTGFRLARTLSN